MEEDEQQFPILITRDRLKARGYVVSSSWGLSVSWRHKDNPGWCFCNDMRLIEGCHPVEWTGGGKGRFTGTCIQYIHELQRMEEITPKA